METKTLQLLDSADAVVRLRHVLATQLQHGWMDLAAARYSHASSPLGDGGLMHLVGCATSHRASPGDSNRASEDGEEKGEDPRLVRVCVSGGGIGNDDDRREGQHEGNAIEKECSRCPYFQIRWPCAVPCKDCTSSSSGGASISSGCIGCWIRQESSSALPEADVDRLNLTSESLQDSGHPEARSAGVSYGKPLPLAGLAHPSLRSAQSKFARALAVAVEVASLQQQVASLERQVQSGMHAVKCAAAEG
ncbi:hypothetical protein CLOM_g9231 [Closterium sp. NIES-68]|nr:hypothetical protein CLOM_g9231 [Closterium sp. NIES-68]GJP62540.1 hypothetical protein CLOP_g19593 [Closterium sp. NIES-67]